ncbi:MAG: type IVB secretion system protein IcmH/DotU [Woeseiaceae bacterium]
MSSDSQDKTVFRQPAGAADRTKMRHRPGGRQAPPQVAPAAQPTQNYQSQQSFDTHAAYFRTGKGLNPLVNTASTLIAVFEKTHKSMSHSNVGGLHQRLVNEIKTFETKAKELGIKPEIILSARYVLCTVLDEAVLNTPWGAESAWTQRTLLSLFHNETSGGEKFFLILDRMRDMPAENIEILELIYIFISLGYEGKYRVVQRGKEALEQIRDELFRIIRNQRGEYERSLSPSWEGLGRIKNSLAEYIPMWVIASVVTAVLLLSYSGFRYWLYESSAPVAQQLTDIADNKVEKRKSLFNSDKRI